MGQRALHHLWRHARRKLLLSCLIGDELETANQTDPPCLTHERMGRELAQACLEERAEALPHVVDEPVTLHNLEHLMREAIRGDEGED